MKNIMTLILHLIFSVPLCLREKIRFDGIAANEGEEPTEDPKPLDFKAIVLEILGLPAEATDEDIAAAVESAKAAAAPEQAEVEAANARFREAREALGLAGNATAEELHQAILQLPTQHQKDLTAANEARAEAQVNLAINEGRIPVGDREKWIKKLKTGLDVAANELAALKPQVPNQELGNMSNQIEVAANAKERIASVKEAVEAYMADKGVDYDTAYAAIKKDPKYKSLFEAMQPAAE